MGTDKRSETSSDRQKWEKIFSALVQRLQAQQTQIETLLKERKFLEDRIKMQHDRWVSDIRLYEDQISQMKEDLVLQEKERALDTSMLKFAAHLKQREAYVCQMKLEYAESELEDFKALRDFLSSKPSNETDKAPRNLLEIAETSRAGRDSNKIADKLEKKPSKASEAEVKRITEEYEKMLSERNSEVSALLAEKKFVWNQYNIMEKDFTTKLKNRNSEVELANEKIAKLLSTMEQLQSSNSKKDDTITALKGQLGKVETDSSKLKEEISKLSHELELVRKSKSASVTPVLKRCRSGANNASGPLGKRSANDRSNVIVKKESSSAQDLQLSQESGKENRSLKRKSVPETPKLFSSSFKVPKLKNPI